VKFRPSRVLGKLRRGDLVSCMKLNLSDPRAAQLAAMHGFDCIWMDTEHSPNTIEGIENQVRAVQVEGADTLVRPGRGSYSEYLRLLEMDCTGLMVPHVMNADDARDIVRQTRFYPVGRRYIDGGNADGRFGNLPTDEYFREANEQRFIVLQIEDPAAMEHLDAIAAVDGFDMLFFGAGDYSTALGIAGQVNHPEVAEARQLVADAARRHGKAAGQIATSPEDIGKAVAGGYTFISLGADVIAMNQYFSAQLGLFQQASAERLA